MKFRDRIGNEMREGDTVAWILNDGSTLKAEVVEVTQPGLASTASGDRTPGRVTLEVQFNFPYDQKTAAQDLGLSAFIVTRDPKSEALIDRVLSS